jgi:hypothetical protein
VCREEDLRCHSAAKQMTRSHVRLPVSWPKRGIELSDEGAAVAESGRQLRELEEEEEEGNYGYVTVALW